MMTIVLRNTSLLAELQLPLYVSSYEAVHDIVNRYFHQKGPPAFDDSKSVQQNMDAFVESLTTWYHSQADDIATDAREPHNWYPKARHLRRRVVFHAGPTNTGKTHAALAALSRAPTGVYCSPLKLLTWEVYHTLRERGVLSGLLLGDAFIPGETHLTCTVEMAPLDQEWDCGVIDEIHMIEDPTRGGAWLAALMGLAAKEVHVCGDPSAVEAVKDIVGKCGDIFEVRRYSRKEPIRIEHCDGLDGVKPADALIVNTLPELYSLRASLEGSLRKPCRIFSIHGAMPSTVRQKQTEQFNACVQRGEFCVLVATSAIAYGLNLSIRRVVLTSLLTFNGTRYLPMAPLLVKQLAGRSGRTGGTWSERGGAVAVLHPTDHLGLVAAMDSPQRTITSCTISPPSNLFLLYWDHSIPEVASAAKAVERYRAALRLNKSLVLWEMDQKFLTACRVVDNCAGDLPRRDKVTYMYASSPALRKSVAVKTLVSWVQSHAAGGTALLTNALRDIPGVVEVTESSLQVLPDVPTYRRNEKRIDTEALEAVHCVCELYITMHRHFPSSYPEITVATKLQAEAAGQLESIISTETVNKHLRHSRAELLEAIEGRFVFLAKAAEEQLVKAGHQKGRRYLRDLESGKVWLDPSNRGLASMAARSMGCSVDDFVTDTMARFSSQTRSHPTPTPQSS